MKTFRIAFYVLLVSLALYSCQKEYSVENSNLKLPSGSWEFKNGSAQYIGDMDTAYIATNGNTKELQLIGTSLDGSQKFHLHLFADTFKIGTYKASVFQSSFTYTSGSTSLFNANQLVGEFIVNITSFGNNVISGNFSGSALDSSTRVVQLSAGKFTSTINISGVAGGVSSGVLGDSSGTCKPVVLSGTYSAGVALTSLNTAQFQVTVAVPGSYTISTNTVNGVTFSRSGTFTSVGVQTVVLDGSGTPVNSGVFDYTVAYGNNQCNFKVDYGNPFTGTLGGGGGACTPFTIGGIYQQGILLNQTNTVQLQVTVNTPGSYSIATNTVSGISFSASGTFATTGLQIVTLAGSGTPTTSGVLPFSVTYGTSSCSFSITSLPGVAPSGDYFPITLNSNWTYGLQGGTTTDSLHFAVINYSPSIAGNTYSTITTDYIPPTGAPDSSYYRKPGGDYYQYVNYSNYFPFDQPVDGEFIFLKDNVATGITWQSPSISGSAQGFPFSGYFKMTLLAKAVPVTIGTFNFPDVIKVQYDFYIAGSPVPVETDERWFAKNVGEIHFSYKDNIGGTSETYDIGNFMVF
ncbi:MAG: hypothetical protein M3015_10015 [Bacteroidota bacterium]|nr:hypothetical protein [Bacteroidota bacterium]